MATAHGSAAAGAPSPGIPIANRRFGGGWAVSRFSRTGAAAPEGGRSSRTIIGPVPFPPGWRAKDSTATASGPMRAAAGSAQSAVVSTRSLAISAPPQAAVPFAAPPPPSIRTNHCGWSAGGPSPASSLGSGSPVPASEPEPPVAERAPLALGSRRRRRRSLWSGAGVPRSSFRSCWCWWSCWWWLPPARGASVAASALETARIERTTSHRHVLAMASKPRGFRSCFGIGVRFGFGSSRTVPRFAGIWFSIRCRPVVVRRKRLARW
mmetsp:Transcript_7697/g.16496  ORF Transcript_7697/g.16496 Transcript_7697/m.16496 type:complete len:266 (+) Transcript_7697:358-1155(+)